MLQTASETVNRALSRVFPERRLILRSEASTRYFRASPIMQASVLALMLGFAGWTGYASLTLAETSLRAAAATGKLEAAEAAYEARIALLEGRTFRMAEALSEARSDEHLALERLSGQHETLTEAMSSEREIAARLRSQQSRLMSLSSEHDSAMRVCEATERRVAGLERQLAGKTAEVARLSDALAALNDTVVDVATARDDAAETTESLVLRVDELSTEISERAERQNRIFAQLEDAAALSLGSLESVFEKSGVPLEPILDAVRREAGGSGGPFIPADQVEALSPDAESAPRLAALMADLERVNLLRIAAERMPFARPVGAARFTSGFGYRKDPFNGRSALHTGIDFSARRGSSIFATAEGRVAYAGWRRGYGKVVEIEHAFGYETVYAHLSEIRVKVGQRVSRGDRIGDMGSTGRSTGTHLHYEVRVDGKPVNPLKYIEAARDVL